MNGNNLPTKVEGSKLQRGRRAVLGFQCVDQFDGREIR